MIRSTWRYVLLAAALILAGGVSACGVLDVDDPTAVEESELNDGSGADLLRLNALSQWYNSVPLAVLSSGMFADEFFADPPSYYEQYGIVSSENLLDRRQSEAMEQYTSSHSGFDYSRWQLARRATTLAEEKLRTFGGASAAAYVGEMLAARAFITLNLGEMFCPGFPLHEVKDNTPIYGRPLSTTEVFERALIDLDSAATYVADSARLLNLVRIGRGRVLLDLGRLDEAATAVADVPGEFVFDAELDGSLPGIQSNILANFGVDAGWGVANNEGGNGLPFVDAGDPRIATSPTGTASDGVTIVRSIDQYPDGSAPVVIASAIEARLIEAEAALAAGGDWRGILNQLRASQPALGLDTLPNPGTPEARLDLLYRERAFWLFATGHRLGDLRRLIDIYGRQPETVLPTGLYFRGASYGTATSMPFPAKLETPFSSAVTGCTTR